MPEIVKNLFDSALFIAIAGAIVGAIISHVLTVRHERKKDRDASDKELQKENADLLSRLATYEATSPSHIGDFLVLKGNGEAICPVCWRANNVAIPLYENGNTGHYICSKCGKTGVFNHKKVQQIEAEQEAAQQAFFDSIDLINQSHGPYY